MRLHIFVLLAAILAFGCISSPQQKQLVGDDRDANGCIGSAGYAWCAAKGKCLRAWEENCTSEVMPGSDRDENGCIGSAGYVWCNATQKCMRPWEENCTSLDLQAQARKFCGTAGVQKVYACGEYVRVVSSLLGGGSAFYSEKEGLVSCPLVAPEYMSEKCKQLLMGSNCVEREVC